MDMDVVNVHWMLWTKGRNRSYFKLTLKTCMPMYAKPIFITIAPPIVNTLRGRYTDTHNTHAITHTNSTDKSNFKKPGTVPG